jgi:hypothetical protein
MSSGAPCPFGVLAGLDPAIQSSVRRCLDRRVKPGDDKSKEAVEEGASVVSHGMGEKRAIDPMSSGPASMSKDHAEGNADPAAAAGAWRPVPSFLYTMSNSDGSAEAEPLLHIGT